MKYYIKRELLTLLSLLVYTLCLFISNIFVLTVGIAVNAPLLFAIIAIALGSLCVWGMYVLYVKKRERVYIGACAFCNILLMPVLLVFMNFFINPLSKLFGVYERFDFGAFLTAVIVYTILLVEMVISMIILLIKNYKLR